MVVRLCKLGIELYGEAIGCIIIAQISSTYLTTRGVGNVKTYQRRLMTLRPIDGVFLSKILALKAIASKKKTKSSQEAV